MKPHPIWYLVAMRRSSLLVLAIFGACSGPPEQAISRPAGLADAGALAPASATLLREESSPRPMPVVSAEALAADAGFPLAREGVTAVEPGSTFRLEVAVQVDDARLVLLDEQDAMVPAQGTTEAAATSRFTLVPSEPLRPGSNYTLRLEGAVRREAHDPAGRAYLPVAMRLRTTGDRPPAGAKKSRRARRR